MLFAEITDWIAVGTAMGTGIAAGGTAIGVAIKYAVNQLTKLREAERKHEIAMKTADREFEAAKAKEFTDTVREIQTNATNDSRQAFTAVVDIQKEAVKAVAEVTAAVRELNTAVTELRGEMTGQRERRRRPRAANNPNGGADSVKENE